MNRLFIRLCLLVCREIGVLTANKVSTRQYKIVAPLNPEKPIKYVRKPIDYSILDEIGHGIHAKQKQRISGPTAINIQVGPPPTTKPPTPPQLSHGMSTHAYKLIKNVTSMKIESTGYLMAYTIEYFFVCVQDHGLVQ